MSVIHIKIKIKNPTCFGHSYSSIIRGSHCLCMCMQYVAVCYLQFINIHITVYKYWDMDYETLLLVG
jgi:hypothetical protein